MVSARGTLFHVAGNRPSDERKGSERWYIQGICSNGSGGCFIVSRGSLYHLPSSDPTVFEKYSESWSSLVTGARFGGLCPDAQGGVYIIGGGGGLWRVTTQCRGGTRLSSKWSLEGLLCSDGFGGCFAASHGELFHTSSSGSCALLASAPSCGQTSALCSAGAGACFALAGGTLWHCAMDEAEGHQVSDGWPPGALLAADGESGCLLAGDGTVWRISACGAPVESLGELSCLALCG